jgi:nuclear transport factor 2 (NTF2) superfamily protein
MLDVLTEAAIEDEEEDNDASNDDNAARVCCSFSSDAAIASRMNSMLCSKAIGEYLKVDVKAFDKANRN